MDARCRAKKKSGELGNAPAVKKGICLFHANPGRTAELGRKNRLARRRAPVQPLHQIPLSRELEFPV